MPWCWSHVSVVVDVDSLLGDVVERGCGAACRWVCGASHLGFGEEFEGFERKMKDF